MEETSVIKSRNPAALLSIWHMVFSRFFTNCEKEYLNKKNEGLMEEIYKNLKALRLAATQVEDDIKLDPKIVEPFTELFKTVPSSRWIEEMNSLVKEMKLIKKDMKSLKKYSSIAENAGESLRFEMEPSKQLESVPHLLTIWYWLSTCWSKESSNKDGFVEGVETKYGVITKVLFHRTIPETQQIDDVSQLTSKLFEMFMSEPECWINALDNFSLGMMQVGRGYMSVVEEARPSSTVYSPYVEPTPYVSFFGKALKYLGPFVGEKVLEAVLDIDCVKKFADKVIDTVKDAAEDVASKATKVVNDVIDTVKDAAEDVASKATKVVNDVIDTVKDAAEDVASGATKVANDIENMAVTTGEAMTRFLSN